MFRFGGRTSNGGALRPFGPMGLNRQSDQARGLGVWIPIVSSKEAQLTAYNLLSAGSSTLGVRTGTVVHRGDPILREAIDVAASSYVDFSFPAFPATTNTFSMSLWHRPRIVPVEGGYEGVLEHRGGSGVACLMYSGVNNGGFSYIWENTSDEYAATTGLVINAGELSLLVLVVRPASATVYRFAPSGLLSWTNTKTHTARQPDSSAWRLAGDPDLSSRVAQGLYADVRIYPYRMLTEDDVWRMYDPATRWDLYKSPARKNWMQASGAVGAVLSGTGGDGMIEAQVVAGGQVITVTLTGDTFISN